MTTRRRRRSRSFARGADAAEKLNMVPLAERMTGFSCNTLAWVPLNFYLDKSMPTRTQHITMSALVDKPKENGKEKQAQTEG